MVAGNIPGLTQTAALAIYDAVQVNDASPRRLADALDFRGFDRGASGRSANAAVTRTLTVSDSLPEMLNVRVVRRVHPGLLLDVSLSLGREIGVVFGPSGAGKTTLLRLIAGLTTPDSGHVWLDGTTLFDAATSGQSAASSATDRDDLPRRLSVSPSECRPPIFVSVSKAGRRIRPDDRLAQVAALCGVEQLLESPSGNAFRRRAAARRAGSSTGASPRLLLCDEPVSALDLANRHALLERLRAVQHAEESRCSMSRTVRPRPSHSGSRLFLLEQGRIVAEGPPLDVLGAARDASPRSDRLGGHPQRLPRAHRGPLARARSDIRRAREWPRTDRPVSGPSTGVRGS